MGPNIVDVNSTVCMVKQKINEKLYDQTVRPYCRKFCNADKIGTAVFNRGHVNYFNALFYAVSPVFYTVSISFSLAAKSSSIFFRYLSWSF